ALGALLFYFGLARALAGTRAATIAACGLAVFGGWSGALLWGAGAQESWMVLGSLASLAAFLARRSWLAAALLVPALPSKDTAAVVPRIALVLALIERDAWSTALRRVAPLALVTVAWALLHPPLVRHDAVAGSAAAFATGGLRTLLSFANLQRVPHP